MCAVDLEHQRGYRLRNEGAVEMHCVGLPSSLPQSYTIKNGLNALFESGGQCYYHLKIVCVKINVKVVSVFKRCGRMEVKLHAF